jgi:hypothetical protein
LRAVRRLFERAESRRAKKPQFIFLPEGCHARIMRHLDADGHSQRAFYGIVGLEKSRASSRAGGESGSASLDLVPSGASATT